MKSYKSPIPQNKKKNYQLLQIRHESQSTFGYYCQITINHNEYRKIAMHYWYAPKLRKVK